MYLIHKKQRESTFACFRLVKQQTTDLPKVRQQKTDVPQIKVFLTSDKHFEHIPNKVAMFSKNLIKKSYAVFCIRKAAVILKYHYDGYINQFSKPQNLFLSLSCSW